MFWQGLGEGYGLAGSRRGLCFGRVYVRVMLWQDLGEGYALAGPRRGLCFGRV